MAPQPPAQSRYAINAEWTKVYLEFCLWEEIPGGEEQVYVYLGPEADIGWDVSATLWAPSLFWNLWLILSPCPVWTGEEVCQVCPLCICLWYKALLETSESSRLGSHVACLSPHLRPLRSDLGGPPESQGVRYQSAWLRAQSHSLWCCFSSWAPLGVFYLKETGWTKWCP